ncbi:MAG: ADP-ribosylglycohydrolase family protein [Acidimicrobiia bacterium]
MIKTKVEGSLLGGAVGDALGLPVEFMSMDEIHRFIGTSGVTGYPELTQHAAFSDDTQMTLWTAEGLIRARQRQRKSGGSGWDPVGVVNGSYLRWFLTQKSGVPAEESSVEGEPLHSGWMIDEPGLWSRVAPGNTCLSALRVGGLGTRHDPINDSKGCGGVMRTAPAGLVGLDDDAAYQLGCDLAALTHGHPAGYIAAGAFSLILNRICAGDELVSAVDSAIVAIEADEPQGRICAELLRTAKRLAEIESPSSFRVVEQLGAGWVAEEALAIAVYGALAADDYREGVLLAVNHSGDSDSTGSIAGQILGATLGADAIPAEWTDGLGFRSVVERVAGDLYGAFYEDRVFSAEEYPPW